MCLIDHYLIGSCTFTLVATSMDLAELNEHLKPTFALKLDM